MADEDKRPEDTESSHLNYTHPVPHDYIELEKITFLTEKIPDFQNKLLELEKDVKNFSKMAAKNTAASYSYDIEKMIFRAFFAELGDRSFQSPSLSQLSQLRASIIHEGLIASRNPPCEICGENRSVDHCHIVPNRLGGSHLVGNILLLCPTHHRMFDRFMLTQAEFAAINWERKSIVAQEYAMTVTLEAHRKFWQQVSEKHSSPNQFTLEDQKPFIRYAAQQILDIFVDARPIKRNRLYKILDPHIVDVAKKIIDQLIKLKLLSRIKIGSENCLVKLKDSPELTDDIVLKIWQEIG